MESDVDGGACFHWNELGKNRGFGSPVGVLSAISSLHTQLIRASLFIIPLFEHLLDWVVWGHLYKRSYGGQGGT